MRKKTNALEKTDYEKLGKLLVSLGEYGYRDKKALYKYEFIKGVMRGLGTVLGATLLLAVLLFLLSLLDELPLIGRIADTIRETIKSPSQ